MNDTAEVLLAIALVCCVACTVSGRAAQYESDYGDSDDDMALMIKRYYNSDGNRQFNSIQRRDWCARWGEQCVPESKARFAHCCDGLRCVCGTLWHSSDRCQCKKASVFGR